MKLVAAIHTLVKNFPGYERHDLASQMRRAAKSVPANIAEGYARRWSVKEFKNYLRMAMASANEMEVHLKIAAELGYVARPEVEQYVQEHGVIGRQLNRLISAWRQLQPTATTMRA